MAEAAENVKEFALERAKEAAHEAVGLRKFENQAALLISFLAMFLAITSVAGGDNKQEILQRETEIADTWAFYQAKAIRRTSTILQKENWELMRVTQGASWNAEQRQQVEQRLAAWEAEIERYRNEPGDGMEDLSRKARALEAQLARALQQHPNFDFAEGLFQIAIVIASVSIITKARALLGVAGLLGGAAIVLMLNGFFLFAPLPLNGH
ncbi:MAG TPA: DUF4337 domain-containing protein [Chloroflexota bacterium]|jgi:hypothetical protein|nr:DUF4337 domain-containing protein [Chloroflexota bacterium]